METTKEYIGHGTKHKEFDLIDVVIEMEKAEPTIFTYEGKRYLKITVAKRKEVSKYGATHTVYVRQKQETAAEPPAEQPKRKKGKKA